MCDVTTNGVACGYDGRTNKKKPAQMLVRIEWCASPDWTRVVKQVVMAAWRTAHTAFRIIQKMEEKKKKKEKEVSQSVTPPAVILGTYPRECPKVRVRYKCLLHVWASTKLWIALCLALAAYYIASLSALWLAT